MKGSFFKATITTAALTTIFGVTLVGCNTPPTKPTGSATAGYKPLAELQIVDCALPGQVNRLGNMTYVSERRATRTTASDCNLRGGEYVAYDRADYRSALNVWLKNAEQGNPEAQTYVGEIFEKGLGQEADYATAALWYSKAAEQGYQRAQINLGFLYEKGLGVAKDVAKALSYYRLSAGGETLVLESDAKQAVAEARSELENKMQQSQQESTYLQTQLQELQKKTAATNPNNQLAVLQNLYDKSQLEVQTLTQKIASLPKSTYRSIDSTKLLQPVTLKMAAPLEFNDVEFGRYFALIIGNQDYLYIPDLQSPRKDALRIQQVLEQRYGFSTVALFDAGEKEILNAFNDLYNQIGPKDNLVVFYAGHGNLSQGSARKRGYWLPANAEQDVLTNWINNNVISDHLDRIKARSILVIADSCFAGNLASENSAFLLGGVNVNLSKQSITQGISRRSRIVISSGGERPVLDGANGEHSIFANALINLLEKNEGVLREDMLFAQVAVNVRQQAKANKLEQTPEMRPIRAAGHEGGDFYFIPRNAKALGSRDDIYSTNHLAVK
ncbi:MAG: caspase family protein [Pseudomonadota bacterium]